MRTERKVEVYTCDNPECTHETRHDSAVDGRRPIGYHGTVVLSYGPADNPHTTETESLEWFAHRKSCVRGAVLAVVDSVRYEPDEETQESIRRGVAQAESGEVVRMDHLTEDDPVEDGPGDDMMNSRGGSAEDLA